MAKKKIGSKHRKAEPKSERLRDARKNLAERKKNQPRKQRKKIQFNLNTKQKRIAAAIALVLLLFMITYGRKIIKLQIENRALRQQQEELNAEKSKLTKELKNIHSEDYIKDQARKKLRLLNEDEKLFIFKGDNGDEEK